jgi:hypothetical protein
VYGVADDGSKNVVGVENRVSVLRCQVSGITRSNH